MTRRLAGHRRPAPDRTPPPPAGPAELAALEHAAGVVDIGEHDWTVPCQQCLGHRPGDDRKRVLRQRALEAANASGREYKAIESYGDPLPLRILYLDGQPPPTLDDTESD